MEQTSVSMASGWTVRACVSGVSPGVSEFLSLVVVSSLGLVTVGVGLKAVEGEEPRPSWRSLSGCNRAEAEEEEGGARSLSGSLRSDHSGGLDRPRPSSELRSLGWPAGGRLCPTTALGDRVRRAQETWPGVGGASGLADLVTSGGGRSQT